MGRKSDGAYTPADIDFYYHDRIEGSWQGIHACVWADDDNAIESVCLQIQTDHSTLDSDAIYDSLDALQSCDCNPCYVCKESGAFDPE